MRLGSPILFKVTSTGKKPLRYTLRGGSDSLKIDPATGILRGSIPKEGVYRFRVGVSNSVGTAHRAFEIKVGKTISLTPPMGWNSWNSFGLGVTEQKVRANAQVMIDKGLVDHGWSYVNLDDGWEAPKRTSAGELLGSDAFPNMKELADWLHSRGLKFGIYSSPGPTTCGGNLGSYQFERQDAETYSKWGVDYLKYDLCSYKWDIFDKQSDKSEAAWIKPFLTMRKELDKLPRDMVFSICSYNTVPWAGKAGANLTRITGDIRDTWPAILNNGFGVVDRFWANNRPGLWNDDDMLVIGTTSGAWEGKPRPNGLTHEEQRSHFSLWCLLSAPLLIGSDLTVADDFTFSIFSNDDLIDLDQDSLGKQARRVINSKTCQVWVKQLEDGSHAVGIFNLLDHPASVSVAWADLGIAGGRARDLWEHRDLGILGTGYAATIASHGVSVIRISR